MPQLQVVDTTENEPDPTDVQKFFSRLGKDYKDYNDRIEIGNLISEYQKNQEDENAYENLQLNLQKSNISPTKRLETQESLNDMHKVISERKKALRTNLSNQMLTAEQREKKLQDYENVGYTREEAEYAIDAPKGVQSTLERDVRERQKRRSTENAPPETQEFLQDMEPDEWPVIPKPKGRTPAELVKWEDNNKKENSKELKAVREKKEILQENESLISQMDDINQGDYLPSGLKKMVMLDPKTGELRETVDLAEAANAQTQLYVKNLNRWQKGAKEYYGSRVTNFDLQSFMKQLPGLMNSKEGRSLILKQMKYQNELDSIYTKTLDEALKKYKEHDYADITAVVDKKVGERKKELIGNINNLVKASGEILKREKNPQKFKGTTLVQDPNTGTFYSAPDEKVENLKKKKWRIF